MQKENKQSSKKDSEICELVDRYFKESLEYRKQFHGEWEECERFYDGNQWPSGVKRPVSNHVFKIVESETPVLTDSRPSTDVVAIDENRKEDAMVLDASKKNVYRQQSLGLKDAMSIKSALITGTAFQYVDFDPDSSLGEGDVTIENISWRQCFPDPTANEVDKCRYFGLKFPMDVEDVKRKWKPTGEIPIVSPTDFMNAISEESQYGEDNNYNNLNMDAGGVNRYQGESITTVDEMWIKDYSMEKVSDEETQEEILKETTQIQMGINPDITKNEDHAKHIPGHYDQVLMIASQALGLPPEQITEQDIEALKQDAEIGVIISVALDHIEMHKAFLEAGHDKAEKPVFKDNLRVVIKVGRKILYNGKNPWEDGMYPVAVFYGYKDERKFFGTGEVKNIIPLQKSLNEMSWSEYSNLRLNGNTGWVMDENSGVDETTLTNEPGLVIKKKQGTEIQRLQPGQASPQLAVRKADDEGQMNRIAGAGEQMMGEAPEGDPSGVAIEKLAQQSIGRIRLKSRGFEEYTLPKRDKLILSRVIKNYTNERKLRIEDNDGQIKFLSYDPEKVRDLNYDLVLSQGTSAGLDKKAVYLINNALMASGVIDPKTFVDATDLPNKGKILKSIAERDQTQMALQQLQLQNLQLKAQFAPQLLTPEEVELIEQQQQPQ